MMGAIKKGSQRRSIVSSDMHDLEKVFQPNQGKRHASPFARSSFSNSVLPFESILRILWYGMLASSVSKKPLPNALISRPVIFRTSPGAPLWVYHITASSSDSPSVHRSLLRTCLG